MVIGLDHVLEIFLLVSFSFSPYFGLVNTSAAYHCLAVTRKKRICATWSKIGSIIFGGLALTVANQI